MERYLSEGPASRSEAPLASGRSGGSPAESSTAPFAPTPCGIPSSITRCSKRCTTSSALAGPGRARCSRYPRSPRALPRDVRSADSIETEHVDPSSTETATRCGALRRIERRRPRRLSCRIPASSSTRNGDGDQVLGYSGLEEARPASRFTASSRTCFAAPRQFVSDRQRVYVDVVADQEPVLDVGCGRGELLDSCVPRASTLEAWTSTGTWSRTVEPRGSMSERAEATEYLEGARGGVAWRDLLGPCDRAHGLRRAPALPRAGAPQARPGGVLVVETVNPHSVPAIKTFWVDLTHEKPVFPEVALALCRLHGFGSAHVVFPNGTDDLERDRREEGEYAVVARASRLQSRDERFADRPQTPFLLFRALSGLCRQRPERT